MATKQPRTQLTIPEDIKVIYKNTAEVLGIPASRLMSNMLIEAAPSVRELEMILTKSKTKAQAVNSMDELIQAVVDDAQGDIFNGRDSELSL